MPPSKVRKAPEVIVFEDLDAKIRDSIHRKDKALKVCFFVSLFPLIGIEEEKCFILHEECKRI